MVQCTLETFNDDAPPIPNYIALSYTWGDDTVKKPIRVNDGMFNVTSNLEIALRYLRKSRSFPILSERLWIDAICINQQDVEERNSQVRRMREVYRRASRVLIWLGADHEPEDEKLWFRLDVWGSNG